jgi:hypothetical protein
LEAKNAPAGRKYAWNQQDRPHHAGLQEKRSEMSQEELQAEKSCGVLGMFFS